MLLAVALGVGSPAAAQQTGPEPVLAPDIYGTAATIRADGQVIDPTNPFFQTLGSNGRSCATCHVPSTGWALSPTEVQARFAQSHVDDPLFTSIDGATSPTADVTTEAGRLEAYATAFSRGLIRIETPIPIDADFAVDAVDDPHGYADSEHVSVFRRPRPTTNLRFASSVLWTGAVRPTSDAVAAALRDQARDAVLRHEQATSPPTDAVVDQLVDFETSLYTAQVHDARAGDLTDAEAHALGGVTPLMEQPFGLGGNDSFRSWWNPNVFNLYTGWAGVNGRDPTAAARQSIARGEQIFNHRAFVISDVASVNDANGAARVAGTCSFCHNSPEVGNHTVSLTMNIGTADAALRTPDVPLYTLVNRTTGERVETTDPGRALVTGAWSDIGAFSVPILRGLAGRSPYFHNGTAATLDEVVAFYDVRFRIGLSAEEKTDLTGFLRTL